MKTILFVCTGNLFRSVTAHYSFNKLIDKDLRIIAESAGTSAIDNRANLLLEQDLLADFKRDHLEVEDHIPRRITQDILDNADLIVAMAKEHKECIKNAFGKDAVLFNQIAFGKDESVADVEDIFDKWQAHLKETKEHMRKTVDYIDTSMPLFIKNMNKFF